MASRNVWISIGIVIIVIVVVGGVAGYYYTQLVPPPAPTFSGDIYASDQNGRFGFGFSSSSITSPGPTLNLNVNQSVAVTFHNLGPSAHNWAIVQTKSTTAPVMFGAQVASAQNPIASGGTGSVTFTPNATGSYYYICQVSGHVDLGMWGNVVVS